MRYESIPRKIQNLLKSGYRFLKDEFGNWALAIIAILIFAIYKPVVKFLNQASEVILYIFLGLLVFVALSWIYKKIFRR